MTHRALTAAHAEPHSDRKKRGSTPLLYKLPLPGLRYLGTEVICGDTVTHLHHFEIANRSAN